MCHIVLLYFVKSGAFDGVGRINVERLTNTNADVYILVINEVFSRFDDRHKNHQILCVIV